MEPCEADEPAIGDQRTDKNGLVWELHPDGKWRFWFAFQRRWCDFIAGLPSIEEAFGPTLSTTDEDRERVGLPVQDEAGDPDEALWLGQQVQTVRDGGYYTIQVDGVLIARCDTYGRTATERSATDRAEKAEAEAQEFSDWHDDACVERDAANAERDALRERLDALREDVERYVAQHSRPAMGGVVYTLPQILDRDTQRGAR